MKLRAVIIATGFREGMESLLSHRPSPLLNVAGKPIIFHILENLLQWNVREFDIILHHLPQMIEERLEDGARWGIHITYHLARNHRQPFSAVSPIARGWKDEAVVLGCGDCLPKMEPINLQEPLDGQALLWMYPDQVWSGWGVLSPAVLGSLPADAAEETLPAKIPFHKNLNAVPFLSVHSFAELKKTNQKFIAQKSPSYLFPATARMVEPGIWISRGVSLHPSASIVPPVFIGENTQIKEAAVIGPYAVIENNCIIDSSSHIENSLVMQGSYVGESLALHNSIVDRNLLINLSLETEVKISDDFILGELKSPSVFAYPLQLCERVLGAMLLIVLSPIYFYMQGSHHLRRDKMLLLPACEDPHLWTSFEWLTFEENQDVRPNFLQRHFRRLPLLINIIRGEVHFVGVVPRALKDAANLPSDWKKLYLRSKVGLISLSDLDETAPDRSDQCYASEAFYAANMGFGYDLKLFIRWLKNKITKFYKSF